MNERFLKDTNYYGLVAVSGVARDVTSRDSFSRTLFSKDISGRKIISGVKNVMSLDNWPEGENPYEFMKNDTDDSRIDRPMEDVLVTDIRGLLLGDGVLDQNSAPKNVLGINYERSMIRKLSSRKKRGNTHPYLRLKDEWTYKRWPDGQYSATKVV